MEDFESTGEASRDSLVEVEEGDDVVDGEGGYEVQVELDGGDIVKSDLLAIEYFLARVEIFVGGAEVKHHIDNEKHVDHVVNYLEPLTVEGFRLEGDIQRHGDAVDDGEYHHHQVPLHAQRVVLLHYWDAPRPSLTQAFIQDFIGLGEIWATLAAIASLVFEDVDLDVSIVVTSAREVILLPIRPLLILLFILPEPKDFQEFSFRLHHCCFLVNIFGNLLVRSL